MMFMANFETDNPYTHFLLFLAQIAYLGLVICLLAPLIAPILFVQPPALWAIALSLLPARMVKGRPVRRPAVPLMRHPPKMCETAP